MWPQAEYLSGLLEAESSSRVSTTFSEVVLGTLFFDEDSVLFTGIQVHIFVYFFCVGASVCLVMKCYPCHCRNLLGEDLDDLNTKELDQLEEQIEMSLRHIRSTKVLSNRC